MKYALFLVVAMVVTNAQAQDNWVTCENIITGHVQMFPGMSCPMNWVPV